MRHSEARNPRVINFLAYVLWSFPFTYVLLLGMFYNLELQDIFICFFSFYNLAHSIIAIATGFALFRMKPYGWHFYCFHSFLMLVEQFYVGLKFGHSPILAVPLAFTTCCILGALYVLKSELRVPYFSPKIAWWESDPRYKISVPTQMTCSDHFYKGDIMDISASGCFIKTKDPLKVDQVVQIKFSLFDHKFDCEGRVVWRTESGVTHPKGVGVRFLGLEKDVNADLRQTVKKLRTLSRKYKDLRDEEKTVTMERKVQALISQRKGS
jgi:Tfp pilus assembly protein PilZ